MGGLTFGLKPEEVSQHLPNRSNALHWDDLPEAKEFTRGRALCLDADAGCRHAVARPVKSCFGDASYVVLLFRNKALFRVSWRFLPDQECPNPTRRGGGLYARLRAARSDCRGRRALYRRISPKWSMSPIRDAGR